MSIASLKHRRGLRALVVGSAIALAAGMLAGCATSSGTTTGSSTADKYGTKSHPITITFWGWGGAKDDYPAIAAYKKLHPYVTVKSTQFASTQAMYTKLATVFKAGTGAPDVTSLELAMLPTFAAGSNLVPLSQYGANASTMNPASAKAANFDSQLYAIPTDSAPMVMYYRSDLFQKYGIAVPTTWAQYLTDAQTLKAKDPTAYMTYMDPGDSSQVQALIWQAGGQPFKLTGKNNLSINLSDAGSTKFANLWSTMLKDKLVKPDPAFTADWFNELSNGTYATWLTGAWGASTLQSSVSGAAGKWRVATLPSWTAGSNASALYGGSGSSVTKQSKSPAAGAAWAEWFGTDWPKLSGHGGASSFPATLQVENETSFVNTPSKVLGGQKDVPVYKTASTQVLGGWEFLPYNLYANSIFKDTVGQNISGDGDVAAGLKAWQAQLATYGSSQGFKVTTR
jgi:multiple sugar transport system substrate-binding protein